MLTRPSLLTDRDIPLAELGGMRLDGEVYPLADAWCAIDEPEGPAHRALAVLGTGSPRLIAELGTAAWVWGASASLPNAIEFCVDLGSRARVRPNTRVRVRELVLEPGDRVELSGAAVTSPVRTAVDLARFRDPLTAADSMTIVELARIGGFDLPACERLLDRRKNLPEKRRALQRLRQLLDQPAFTR
jgi:hypothetical protein